MHVKLAAGLVDIATKINISLTTELHATATVKNRTQWFNSNISSVVGVNKSLCSWRRSIVQREGRLYVVRSIVRTWRSLYVGRSIVRTCVIFYTTYVVQLLLCVQKRM